MKPKTRKTNSGISKAASVNMQAQRDNVPKPVNADPRNSQESVNNHAEVDRKAMVPLVPKTVQVDFKLFEPRAKRVSLCSEFNSWSPAATPMNRCQDGQWSVTLNLKPGRYEYKFLVDGEWIADPKARENLSNQYGTLNSVIEIQA